MKRSVLYVAYDGKAHEGPKRSYSYIQPTVSVVVDSNDRCNKYPRLLLYPPNGTVLPTHHRVTVSENRYRHPDQSVKQHTTPVLLPGLPACPHPTVWESLSPVAPVPPGSRQRSASNRQQYHTDRASTQTDEGRQVGTFFYWGHTLPLLRHHELFIVWIP